MALCVLAAAWKKAAGRKAAGEEGSDASAFVDGLLGVVVDHGLRPESADEARLVCDRVRGMGNLIYQYLISSSLLFHIRCILFYMCSSTCAQFLEFRGFSPCSTSLRNDQISSICTHIAVVVLNLAE